MKKDNLIFIHKLLKAIADSIIKVFIPLYILKETSNLNLSLIYLVVYSLSVLLLMNILKKFIQKFSVIAIFLHFIPIVATMGILSFGKINLQNVIITAVIMSISQTLYSIPINLIFTFSDKKINVGKFEISTNIGKLIFTIISALILSSDMKNSFLFLSITSSIFYILCVIPLIFTYKELLSHYNSSKSKDIGNQKVKVDPYFIIFHITFGLFQIVMDYLLPLYLYINDLSFKSVALMVAVVELLKVAANYISQSLVKKKKQIICIITSAIIFLICSISVLIVKDKTAIYILSCITSISFPLTFVPMFRLYCNYLRETSNVFNGITNRDIEIFSVRPVLFGAGLVGIGIVPSFIVGIVALPVMLFSELKLLKKYNN